LIGLSFVAFIDILGFGQMVVTDCESAKPGEKYLPALKSAIHTVLAAAETVSARITQFSDSIVISLPFSTDPNVFASFLSLCADLQRILFRAEILCRGGVSHGRHFHDETILFSQGLIDAYALESQKARDPRVLVSKETLDLIFSNNGLPESLIKDSDDQYFLDYMSGIELGDLQPIMERYRPQLASGSVSVRSKLAWLFRYAHFSHAEIQIPEELAMRRM
jgi:hypothetical protein